MAQKRITHYTKLPSMRGSGGLNHTEFIICSLTLHCKRLFLRLEVMASRPYGNNFTIAPKLPFIEKKMMQMKKKSHFFYHPFTFSPCKQNICTILATPPPPNPPIFSIIPPSKNCLGILAKFLKIINYNIVG